jgi:hypothetical protein
MAQVLRRKYGLIIQTLPYFIYVIMVPKTFSLFYSSNSKRRPCKNKLQNRDDWNPYSASTAKSSLFRKSIFPACS